ncbi:hypothetical protein L345_08863, partial [Ophiophagus hannah]
MVECWLFFQYQDAWPGESPPIGDQRLPPKDYMVESVLVTIFCCLFTGLIALVYSHEVWGAEGDLSHFDPHRRMLKIQTFVNWLLFMMVAASWGHGMPLGDLLTREVHGEARFT